MDVTHFSDNEGRFTRFHDEMSCLESNVVVGDPNCKEFCLVHKDVPCIIDINMIPNHTMHAHLVDQDLTEIKWEGALGEKTTKRQWCIWGTMELELTEGEKVPHSYCYLLQELIVPIGDEVKKVKHIFTIILDFTKLSEDYNVIKYSSGSIGVRRKK